MKKKIIRLYILLVILQCIFVPYNIVRTTYSNNIPHTSVIDNYYQFIWYRYYSDEGAKYKEIHRDFAKNQINLNLLLGQLAVTTILFASSLFMVKKDNSTKENV